MKSCIWMLAVLCATGPLFGQSAGPRVVEFSGHRWIVKQGDRPRGPGPNYFSGAPSDVWVDPEGRLHLRIARHGGRWTSAEVYSEKTFGYGTYVFVVAGAVDRLDPNAVLGLYTWDDRTFPTNANSEIDIEFARWGDPHQKMLQYSVQPVRGPDVPEGQIYRERFFEIEPHLTAGRSTHRFTWTPGGVSYLSVDGEGAAARTIASWEFKPVEARRAREGEKMSAPVAVPKPGAVTRAQMNLWLVDLDRDGLGDPPTDGKEIEVVIERFEYRAAGSEP